MVHDSMEPRFHTLSEWLGWQETLHPKKIDLGLERVCAVLARLGLAKPHYLVINVAGTNGKGSSVAMLAAILQAADYKVGVFTSPHLQRYNERIRVNNLEVSDTDLCDAFARIDAARGSDSLTYFEFGTLAAIVLFADAMVDVAVLEVGLGGRLDAVNAVHPDAALITSIGIDHSEWLGDNRDQIGAEKAGILRASAVGVCSDTDAPKGLLETAQAAGVKLNMSGRDFHYANNVKSWRWWNHDSIMEALPRPTLIGDHQLANAAGVIAVLQELKSRLPVGKHAIDSGLINAYMPARFQVIPGSPEWIVDVAHNPAACAVLAAALADRPCAGRTLAIIGMLADKDAIGAVSPLSSLVDEWHVATTTGERGLSAEALVSALTPAKLNIASVHHSIAAACEHAKIVATPADRIVTFGSFAAAAGALNCLGT